MFLEYQGNFKAVQEQKGMAYPAVKKIADIVLKLGINNIKNEKEEALDVPTV
ncbi:MAG: hypothetical protein QHH06_14355 [Clostridiales bacterium]|nr:hypothetical protein [Eubacteriales bacterium]MDH7567625.1 hypothetical protein [Clostridiales bacterium]